MGIESNGHNEAGRPGSPPLSDNTVLFCGLSLILIAFLWRENHVLWLGGLKSLDDYRALAPVVALLRVCSFDAGVLLIYYRRRAGVAAGGRRGWGFPLRVLGYSLAYLIFEAALLIIGKTTGPVLLMVVAAAGLAALLTFKGVAALTGESLGRSWRGRPLNNLALLFASTMLVMIVVEVPLEMLSRRGKEGGGETPLQKKLVMPAAWARREAKVEGAGMAYYWQGKLHVFNKDAMRRVKDFEPKRPGVFRIIVIGDSLTYGVGIAAEDTYSSLMERELIGDYRVEVLNLGQAAAQSEDVFRTLEKMLPRLDPDLVVYGVCLNDFLPSMMRQYKNNYVLEVHLPFKSRLMEFTQVGRLIAERYNDLLMKIGIRADFITDILRDFRGYQKRFAEDVARMNRLVVSSGLPPVITLVLHQVPDVENRSQDIVLAAEKYLREAGMEVVPSDYIKEHSGRNDLRVSRWEGHPNEEANAIFAAEILEVLRERPELRGYRRTEEP